MRVTHPVPELPEVEVVRLGLAPAVTGATITGVEVFDERSLKRHRAATGDFVELLTGSTIEAAVRRGKFLWFPLSNGALPNGALPNGALSNELLPGGTALVAHLGMSGQVLLREPNAGLDHLLRIRLTIEHPEHGELALHFVDQRIFGSMAVDTLLPSADGQVAGYSGPAVVDAPWARSIPSQVAHIARDPLDEAFDDGLFLARLARTRSGIKRALLDQRVISGIGNIYADEALWGARVHYEQPAGDLSKRRARLLLAEVRTVLHKALAEGGTSFDAQYVNVNGQSGYFAHSLNAYGRQGQPCARCGREIRRAAFMNRSSHFCAYCQRLRRPRPAA